MKKNIMVLILCIQSMAWASEPLNSQVTGLVKSINMYLDRAENEINSNHKTKAQLASAQIKNAQETIDLLFSSRYINQFDHKHPDIIDYQKRVRKLRLKIKR